MYATIMEWAQILTRWAHVFLGIMWIGSTWYFTWLDGQFHGKHGQDQPQVWMVHSGGFYAVRKESVPDPTSTIHWFRYESLLTWITGMILLTILYYQGEILVDEDVWAIDHWTASVIGTGFLLLTWPVYDLLWRSPIGRNERAGAAASYVLLVGCIWGITQVFSGRAAYIHVGAMLGTLMVSNVWMRILPAQRQLIAAAKAGKPPDPHLAERAQQRSKHNTFMVMPLLLTMISNHYPVALYGNRWNWVVLSVLVLVGWVAAWCARRV